MKVLTFSRHFPKGHPKAGQPTFFVEKIWKQLQKSGVDTDTWVNNYVAEMKCELGSWYEVMSKYHTIRAGNRWKAGDMASLRVWSGLPYRSKQIEFAQVRVRAVWQINLHIVDDNVLWQLPGIASGTFDTHSGGLKAIAKNDGLEVRDFIDWFSIHPKTEGRAFTGQIICWSDKINY